MATIILNVPDESLVSKVKQACKMLVGVSSVKVESSMTKKEDFDVTETSSFKRAMEDVKNGRVTTYASLDEFYKEMGL